MRSPIYLVGFLALMLALPAQAEDAPADVKVTSILAAIEKNGAYAFAEAEADIAIARARLDGARAGLMPRLTVNASGEVYETVDKAYRSTDDREGYANLGVVQPIYDFGQTYGKIKSQRAKVAAAQARAQEARNIVLMEGLAVFYALHASELKLRADFEAHASAYVTWERAKERMELGLRSPLDVAKALDGVESTRLTYYRERALNGELRARLTELSGLTFSEELIGGPKAPAEKPESLDLNVLIGVAMDANPEIVVLNHELAALGHQRDGIGALPTLEAYGDVNHYSRDLRGRDEWAVGARLKWPLFDGGLTIAKQTRWAAETAKISARLEVKKRALERKIRKLVIDRETAYQRVIAAKAKLDYSTRALMQRQRQYEQERVTRLGFAMIDNTNAEAELTRASGQYVLAGARLAMALGAGPGVALEPDFVSRLTGGKAIQKLEQFVPKEGSGFGQDDADKVNRKKPR